MNSDRRKFLKIIFVGSGVLLAKKVLTPLFSTFPDNSSAQNNPTNKTNFGNFRIIEDQKQLSIYDNSGEEIFQIDKST